MIRTLEMNHLKDSQEILLIVVVGVLSVGIIFASNIETVSAENNIRQIIKIDAIYPANVASADFVIDPPLFNLSKSFAFITYSHTGENDHSDTWRSYEFIDVNTIRLKGDITPTGNRAIEFVAYIVEYENTSTMFTQEILGNVTIATGATINFTIPIPINITSSMLVSQGHHANFSETSVGNEEMERHRILDSTTWEYFVTNEINTEPQGNIVSVIDWSQSDISVQRGIGSIAALDDLPVTVSPPTDVDRSRTILLVTNAHDGLFSQDPDDMMIRATLDATVPPNIVISRDGGKEGRLDFTWELIEFPANMVKVHYDSVTILGGIPAELTKTDIIPEVQDYSKTVVISTVGTPFGWGQGSSASGTEGAIDTGMVNILLLNNTEVQFQRGDSTDTAIIDYQVIQFLEKDFAQNAQGNNTLLKVVKFDGQYTGATRSQDFTITPALSDVSKSILFMSYSDNSSSTDVTPNILKRHSIIDTTTLRISGNNDASLVNNPINFTATIVEFDSSSPIFVQKDQSQHPDSIEQPNAELKMHMSPVNTTNSFILKMGMTATMVGTDTTMGFEEIRRVRILNGSSWGWNFENPDNSDSHVGEVSIIDWNSNTVAVQRGQASLSGTTVSVSPVTDVIRNQTLLFVTHRTSNGEPSDEIDDAGLLSTLDNSIPPNIVFERTDGTDAPLEINWELISFPLRTLFVQHGIHNQTAGTSNSTSTIERPVSNLTTAFAIGTTNGYGIGGYSGGKGSLATVDVDTFGEIVGQITLEDSSTVRFERGLSVGSWDVGFQVIEFQGTFSEVAMETVGGDIETNATTGIPIPACCNDGPAPDSEASYTEIEIAVLHQLLEWFEPTNAALEAMIDDIENNGKALFEIILRMNNGTYGVDANLTESAVFYQDKYLTVANLTDFINQIEPDVRTEFGAPP